jgi:predicted GNAT family N-acyltransferase
LGRWATNQRFRIKTLSPEQIQRLNQLGFSWDPLAELWEANFAALEKFRQREGHCLVPAKLEQDGLKLGTWVCNQRAKKDTLLPHQFQRLDQLSFTWDPLAEAWETNFGALQRFYTREGHCRVSREHQEDGLKLGVWIGGLRLKKDTLLPGQIQRLNELGFSWDPRIEAWEENFATLQRFCAREGHCRVRKDHQEDGLNLGQWVNSQRSRKERLSPEQIQRLNGLGFSWDPLAEAWEANFAALQRFYTREGHCRVGHFHKENGVNLGFWVSNLRAKKYPLDAGQIKRLNQLAFIWSPRG